MEKWKFCGLIFALVCVLMFAPVAACHATLVKTATSDVCTGDAITYTIKATYSGTNGYYIKIVDTLPAGVTVTGNPDGGIISGNTVTWIYGPVNNGNVKTVTLTVTAPNAAGALSNTAQSYTSYTIQPICVHWKWNCPPTDALKYGPLNDGRCSLICDQYAVPWNNVQSSTARTNVDVCQNTPEFPTMVIPAIALISMVLIAGYLKRKDF
jgi:hypothetical protein